jgi:adenylate cyclase
VGEIKSEIVFHGDVLNTMARIEGLCNSLGADLLVSEELVRQLPSTGLELRDCGEQVLKGKEQRVHVYAVRVAG